MRRIKIVVAGVLLALAMLAASGAVRADGTITYLDAPGSYLTTCLGGVVGVSQTGQSELVAMCGSGGAEVVLCGGLIDWAPEGDQALVTCETGTGKP